MSLRVKKEIFFAAVAIISLFFAEVILRILMPELGSDIYPTGRKKDSIWIFPEDVGYVRKPYAVLSTRCGLKSCTEFCNSKGFRGKDYTIPKPKNLFRIVAIGDSVVEAFGVHLAQTWEQLLQKQMNEYFFSIGSSKRCEVINLGVGGYVSWQAVAQFKKLGVTYQPDLVLVMVGVNDLLYSSRADWKQRVTLKDLFQEKPVSSSLSPDTKKSFWYILRRQILRYSYLCRLFRESFIRLKNNIWTMPRIILQHQQDSGKKFNEEALQFYLNNLEEIYVMIIHSGAKMGIITYPTILSSKLVADRDIYNRIAKLYLNFPLSIRELLNWFERYKEEQVKFASRHKDVILIDAAEEAKDLDKKERMSFFVDWVHLTPAGNHFLARKVFHTILDHYKNNSDYSFSHR